MYTAAVHKTERHLS